MKSKNAYSQTNLSKFSVLLVDPKWPCSEEIEATIFLFPKAGDLINIYQNPGFLKESVIDLSASQYT